MGLDMLAAPLQHDPMALCFRPHEMVCLRCQPDAQAQALQGLAGKTASAPVRCS